MRKITLFGLSAAALAASGWIATASAQAPDAAPPPPADTSTPPAAPDSGTPPATPDSGTSAPKMPKHHKHMMHGSMHGKQGGTGDAAVEDLNAQSLDAAKSGKNFTPSATPAPMGKSDKMGKMDKPMHPMHHHRHMMKKKAAAADAAAPADTSASPPAPDAGSAPPK